MCSSQLSLRRPKWHKLKNEKHRVTIDSTFDVSARYVSNWKRAPPFLLCLGGRREGSFLRAVPAASRAQGGTAVSGSPASSLADAPFLRIPRRPAAKSLRAVQLHLSVHGCLGGPVLTEGGLHPARQTCGLRFRGKHAYALSGPMNNSPGWIYYSLLPKLVLGTDIITKLHFNLNGHFLACNQDSNSRYQQGAVSKSYKMRCVWVLQVSTISMLIEPNNCLLNAWHFLLPDLPSEAWPV